MPLINLFFFYLFDFKFDGYVMWGGKCSAEIRPQHIVQALVTGIFTRHINRLLVIQLKYIVIICYFKLIPVLFMEINRSNEFFYPCTIDVTICKDLQLLMIPLPCKTGTVFVMKIVAIRKSQKLVFRILKPSFFKMINSRFVKRRLESEHVRLQALD